MTSLAYKKLVTVLAVLSMLLILPTSGPSVRADSHWLEGPANFSTGTKENLDLTAQGLSLDIAQSPWMNPSASSPPPARECFPMAYDSRMDEAVMFGGYDGNTFFSDTWAYNLTTNQWTNMAPPNHPGGLDEHTMEYDSKEGKFVLFGGYSTNNDTWTYDLAANDWTKMSPALAPSARAYQAMTYDSVNDRMILFSGYTGSDAPDDTWAYDLTTDTWTNKNPAVEPSGRDFTSMAFDSDRGEAVLFGGFDGTYLDDTWAYNLTTNTWTNMNPSYHPLARNNHIMTYDPQIGKFLLFGGNAGPTTYGETWTYDLGTNTWAQVDTTVKAPHGRTCAAMTYDSRAKKVLLTGGDDPNGTLYNDLWTFQGLMPAFGTYISAPFDAGGPADLSTIEWTATVPATTAIRFQIRTADTNESLKTKAFVGPDGTKSTYYTSSGQAINSLHNGSRWFQYFANLSTSDITRTPVLSITTINYDLWPDAPMLVSPTSGYTLGTGTPYFNWTFRDKDSTSQGAFEWQLDENSQFTSVDRDSGIILSSFTSYKPSSALPDGTWFWRVRTRDSEGAWGPYSQTWAVIIDTIHGVANLYIVNMTVDKDSVMAGQHVTIKATIQNNGTVDANNIKVMLYDGLILVGTKVVTFPKIAAVGVTFDWDTTDAANGTHVLKVVVAQSNKEKTVLVDRGAANLSVVNMSVDKGSVRVGGHVTINATIRNNGTLDANNIKVMLYDDYLLVGTQVLSFPKNSDLNVTFDWDTTGAANGTHVLKVVVGSSEKQKTVFVDTYQGIPNPYVKSMAVDRSKVLVGKTVTVTATIGNNGTADADLVLVELYDGSTLLGTKTISVPKDGNVVVSFDWSTKNVTLGNHFLKVVVGQSMKKMTVAVQSNAKTQVICSWPLLILIILITIIVLILIIERRRMEKVP